MTAVNIFVEHDHARIYTDGALWNSQGVITGFINKVLAVPHLDGVIAWSGKAEAGFLLAGLFSDRNANTFDEAADMLQPAVRSEKERFTNSMLCFVGWSERSRRMRNWVIHCDGADGLEPLTRSSQDLIIMPPPQDMLFASGSDPVALIQSQRASKIMINGALHHTVGGFIQETIVAQEGSKTRIIHRWPDQIGQVITL